MEDMDNVTVWNETDYQKLLSWSFYTMFPVIHLILAFFVFVANLLVIFAFFRFEKLRTLTNYFVVNLACSDLMTGVAILFCRALVLVDTKMFSANGQIASCILKYFFGGLGFNTTMLNLLWVAIERYIKLFYALRYEEILTRTRVIGLIIFTWVMVIAINVMAAIFHNYDTIYICNTNTIYHQIYAVYIFGAFFIPLSVGMIFIYARIGLLTRQHRKKIQASDVAGQSKVDQDKHKELKVAMMMAYIVSIVIIVYSINYAVNILGYINKRGISLKYDRPIPEFAGDYIWLEGIMITGYCINSAINPVIYHWKSPDFRNAFKTLLGCSTKDGSLHSSSGGSSTASTKATHA